MMKKVLKWVAPSLLGLVLALAGCASTPSSPAARPVMGIRMDPSAEEGVLIASLVKGGPADSADLRKGDLIVHVEDFDVEQPGDYHDALSHQKPGNKVTVLVERGKHKKQFTVTLGTSKEEGVD